MDSDQKGHIRFLFNQKKETISHIAREVEVSRWTVRRVLRNDEPKKKIERLSKLDAFKEEIQFILSERPNLSNVVILEKLKAKGYEGGKSILGDYLLKLRGKNNRLQAYLNIETLPGREAQADTGHIADRSLQEIIKGSYTCSVWYYPIAGISTLSLQYLWT